MLLNLATGNQSHELVRVQSDKMGLGLSALHFPPGPSARHRRSPKAILSEEVTYDTIASQLDVPRSSSPPPLVRVIMCYIQASNMYVPKDEFKFQILPCLPPKC